MNHYSRICGFTLRCTNNLWSYQWMYYLWPVDVLLNYFWICKVTRGWSIYYLVPCGCPNELLKGFLWMWRILFWCIFQKFLNWLGGRGLGTSVSSLRDGSRAPRGELPQDKSNNFCGLRTSKPKKKITFYFVYKYFNVSDSYSLDGYLCPLE